MSSNSIKENYSNVLDYLAKTLSIFKCHVEYNQKITEDCHSLFQLGKLLHKDYEKLLESTNTLEMSTDLNEQDPIMASFEEMVDNTPIDALHNLWVIKNEEIDQNIQSYDEPIIITTTTPEPEITTQPYKLLSKQTNNYNRQKTHKCSVCSKEFGRKYVLTRHMLVHTGKKPFECLICPNKFTTSGNLKDHMSVHTGKRKFECLTCGNKFSRADTLKTHMLNHEGEQPFGCSICPNRFNSQASLNIHMRIHSKERPFECSICKKKFTQSCNLKTHMRVHTNERPFGCSFCLKKFRDSSNLNKHMYVHTGE